MIAPKQILVATDFSEISGTAIRCAVELAKRFDAELVGCHVLETHSMLPDIAEAGETANVDVQASNARETLEKLLKEAGADRFRVLIEKGYANKEVVRAARNEGIEMIVVGTHGRGGLAHALLGSTAEYVVRHAECPVMVAKPTKAAIPT